MISRIFTINAVILVTLAALQGLMLAALPIANYWRSDIEKLLSERLQAEVTVAKITAKVSWTGPYLEALNLVIKRPEGSLKIRRLQMLMDFPTSITELKPSVGQLILEEGEIVQRRLAPGVPEPVIWGSLLDQLHELIRPVGAFRLYNFDVVLDEISFKRLSVEISPETGVLAKMRVVTQNASFPVELDWRYPSKPGEPHDIRLNSAVNNFLIPLPGLESLPTTLKNSAWVSITPGKPIESVIRISGKVNDADGLDADLKARIKFSKLHAIEVAFESLQLKIPGVHVSGYDGGIQFNETQLMGQIPRLSIDGGKLGAFIESHAPESKLLNFLMLNHPNIEAKDIQFKWPYAQAPSIIGKIDAFDMKADGSIPEVRRVGGNFYLNGSRGWFDFKGAGVSFALPDIFPSRWLDQKLSGTLAFDQSDDALLLRGQALRSQDAFQDIAGSLLLNLPRGKEQQVQLELMVDATTDALLGLLPHTLDTELIKFLDKTVENVKIESGRISYSGPLGPDVKRSRRDLSMRLPLNAYKFKPLTPWPAIEGHLGTFNFVDQLADIELRGADFGGLNISKVTGRYNNDDEEKIEINGQLSGEASKVLSILDVAGIMPEALGGDVLLDGGLNGNVNLTVLKNKQLEGNILIETDGLTIALSNLSEQFTDVRGSALYRLHDGLYTNLLSGKLMDDKVEAIVTIAAGVTNVNGNARLQTQNINHLIGLGFSDQQIYGEADWTINWREEDDQWKLLVETDGKGLGSRLPRPLGKEPALPSPIIINLKTVDDKKDFSALIFERTKISGEIGINPMSFEVVTQEADLFGWANFSSADSASRNLFILLRTDRLIAGDTSLAVSKTGILLGPKNIEISFDGTQLAGRIERVGEGPLDINLEKLILPPGGDFLDPSGEDPLINYDPGKLPSARIKINTLMRGDKSYRDLNFIIVSGESRLDAVLLEFEHDGQRFSGELAWVNQDGKSESALLLSAQGQELGNFLRVNKNEPLLEANTGHFVSNLRWDGSPFGFSILTSEGSIELSLKDGRFLDLGNSAEVLRLFGILNIETITRRLQLDFLDLVQPGVAFDQVNAKASLRNGELTFAPELSMRGPSSSFRLTGTANLTTQKLDQKLEVDIPLTNNLPLASVLLGAPQIGGAIYLVEKALGRKIIKVGKTDYRIEGSFDDPIVSLITPFLNKKDKLDVKTPPNGQ